MMSRSKSRRMGKAAAKLPAQEQEPEQEQEHEKDPSKVTAIRDKDTLNNENTFRVYVWGGGRLQSTYLFIYIYIDMCTHTHYT